MKKVIFDTNVIVSALIQNNYPHHIVYDYILNKKYELCLSSALFDEYSDVLTRPKFAKLPMFVQNAQIVLNHIYKNATFFVPTAKIGLLKDKSDNKLLELADESKADFLITGNSSDFTLKKYKDTFILSPRDFWDFVVMLKN